jgi:hypothetical protein
MSVTNGWRRNFADRAAQSRATRSWLSNGFTPGSSARGTSKARLRNSDAALASRPARPLGT